MIRPPFALARRFVAGETLPEAIAAARRLNGRGLKVTLDILGENVRERGEALAARDEYVRLLDEIARSGVDSNISIKLTMLGLDQDEAFCEENLRAVLATARGHGNFVRIDMEGSRYTAATLELFHRVFVEFRGEVGAVVQSYLFRSEGDVDALNAAGARVRLVKGAYKEPPSIAYAKRDAVNASYDRLAQKLLAGGVYPAIATHDEERIARARAFAAERGLPLSAYEFQMLYGVRRKLQEGLAQEGHPVRTYVPYGRDWFPYFFRRLRERKENVAFLLRNLFRD